MKTLLFFINIVVTIYGTTTLACTCLSPTSERFLDEIESVFVGSVKSKQWSFSVTHSKYKFKIDKVLLGEFPSEISVWSKNYGPACGYRYEVGSEYLVVTHRSKKKYRSGLCSSWPISSFEAQHLIGKIAEQP